MQRYLDSLGPVVKITPDEIHFESGAIIQLQEEVFDEAYP